jgi:hypothetical protein
MVVDMLKGTAVVNLAHLLPQYADSPTQFLNFQISLAWQQYWGIFSLSGPTLEEERALPLYLAWCWEFHPGPHYPAREFSCLYCFLPGLCH